MGDCEDQSKYKNYAAAISKCLKTSESAREWADLISFLQRLNKVISTAPPTLHDVPYKHLVAKRLAQCMNPSLPSGVHLKAIEIYDIIFSRLGSIQLQKDLHIYAIGLFPLYNYAPTAVKPNLLAIYEDHVLPLGKSLTPFLKSVLMSLFPGLEEGGEFYSRTLKLLDKIYESVSPSVFYCALWSCLISGPSIRVFSVSYLPYHFKNVITDDSKIEILLGNSNLMVAALAECLEDKNILVTRVVLDIISNYFPFHKNLLDEQNMKKLITPAMYIVLKRDMSLNRRLYLWLLGPSEYDDAEYFQQHVRAIFVDGISKELLDSRNQTTSLPYKMLVVLVEKVEIGKQIVKRVIIPVFKSLEKTMKESSQSHFNEVLRSASLFFNLLDASVLLKHLASLIDAQDCQCTHMHDFDNNYAAPEMPTMEIGDDVDERDQNQRKEEDCLYFKNLQTLHFALNIVDFKKLRSRITLKEAFSHLFCMVIESSTLRINPDDLARDDPAMACLPLSHLLFLNKVLFRNLALISSFEGEYMEETIFLSEFHSFAGHIIDYHSFFFKRKVIKKNVALLFHEFCELSVIVIKELSKVDSYGLNASNASIPISSSASTATSSLSTTIDALALPGSPTPQPTPPSTAQKISSVSAPTSPTTSHAKGSQLVSSVTTSATPSGAPSPAATSRARFRRTSGSGSPSFSLLDRSKSPRDKKKDKTSELEVRNDGDDDVASNGKDDRTLFDQMLSMEIEDLSPEFIVSLHAFAEKSLATFTNALLECMEANSWDIVYCSIKCYLSLSDYVCPLLCNVFDNYVLSANLLWEWLCPNRSHPLSYSESVENVRLYLDLNLHCFSYFREQEPKILKSGGQPFSPNDWNKYHKAAICENLICSGLSSSNVQVRLSATRRFILMWKVTAGFIAKKKMHFKRATCLMIDLLEDHQLATQLEARSWLSIAMTTLPSILRPIFDILLDPTTRRRAIDQSTTTSKRPFISLFYIQNKIDMPRIEYAINSLLVISRCGGGNLISALTTTPLDPDSHIYSLFNSQLASLGNNAKTLTPKSYLDILLLIVLWFVQSEPINRGKIASTHDHPVKKITAKATYSAPSRSTQPFLPSGPSTSLSVSSPSSPSKPKGDSNYHYQHQHHESPNNDISSGTVLKKSVTSPSTSTRTTISETTTTNYKGSDPSSSSTPSSSVSRSKSSASNSTSKKAKLRKRINSESAVNSTANAVVNLNGQLDKPTSPSSPSSISSSISSTTTSSTAATITMTTAITPSMTPTISSSSSSASSANPQTTILVSTTSNNTTTSTEATTTTTTATAQSSLALSSSSSSTAPAETMESGDLLESKLTSESNSRIQVLCCRFLLLLLSQVHNTTANNTSLFHSLSSYVGPASLYSNTSREITSDKLPSKFRRSTQTPLASQNKTETYESTIFDRLDLIQDVILCRLSSVLTEDKLEVQVSLLELLQSVIVLNHLKNHVESVSTHPLFLDTILLALNMPALRSVHAYWITYTLTCLPFVGQGLLNIVTSVLQALGQNLIQSAKNGLGLSQINDDENLNVDPSYTVSLLEGIGGILSFSILGPAQELESALKNHPSKNNLYQPYANNNNNTTNNTNNNSNSHDNNHHHNCDSNNRNNASPIDNHHHLHPEIKHSSLTASRRVSDSWVSGPDHIAGGSEHSHTNNASHNHDPNDNNSNSNNNNDSPARGRRSTIANDFSSMGLGDVTRAPYMLANLMNINIFRMDDDFTSVCPLEEIKNSILGSLHLILDPLVEVWEEFTSQARLVQKDYQKKTENHNLSRDGQRSQNKRFLHAARSKQVAYRELLRARILDSLNVIFWPSPDAYLDSMCLLWQEECLDSSIINTEDAMSSIPFRPCSNRQLVLVSMLIGIGGDQVDFFLQSISRKFVRLRSNIGNNVPRMVLLNESLLFQILFTYFKHCNGEQMIGCWETLSSFLRNVDHETGFIPSLALLLASLNIYVLRSKVITHRRIRKGLQDSLLKLISALSHAAVSLEQGFKLSSFGLIVLKKYFMSTVDAVFISTEKDKAHTFVASILTPIFPLLKTSLNNDNTKSGSLYYDAMNFLVDISHYQFCARAWKREVNDLFFDPSFFKTSSHGIQCWLSIVGNFCKYEKGVLEEVLEQAKLISSGSTLNIFSTHAQEVYQRARMLKRMAMIVFAAKMDEYAHLLPVIMERVVENLRLNNCQYVHEQVFFLLKVILLRVTEPYLIAWWTTIIFEIQRVFERTLKFLKKTGDLPYGDLRLLFSCCKFVDVTILFRYQQFEMLQLSFFEEVEIDKFSHFVPYVRRLAHRITFNNNKIKKIDNKDKIKEKEKDRTGTGSISTHQPSDIDDIAALEIIDDDFVNVESYVEYKEEEDEERINISNITNLDVGTNDFVNQDEQFQRRQIVLKNTSISTIDELLPFFSYLCNLHCKQNQCKPQDVDVESISKCIQEEFVEPRISHLENSTQ